VKILIATPYFWPRVGGMENYTRFLARGLTEVGCEVVVVCGDPDVQRPVRTQADGYPVWRLPVWKVVSNTPVNLSWWWWLRRIVTAERPDVVNAHTPVPFMVDMASWVAGRTPVVVTYHASTLFKQSGFMMSLITRGYLALQWFSLARAKTIIAVSPYVREQLRRWRGKTIVVANAVSEVAAARTEPGTGLIFVNNLDPSHRWKGLDLLLNALGILKRSGVDLPLVVIGDGADRPRYERRVRELGLAGTVRFARSLVGSERDALIRQAAALVLCSTTPNDAFPTVMLEAWAQGTAVVATAIGPLSALVDDGITGLLVQPNDAGALAKCLHAAVADPARLAALGEAGRQLVAQEYTWPRQVDRTLAALEKLVQSSQSARPSAAAT
jgi:glycosyltransferase involved in cell wall biosynthesis